MNGKRVLVTGGAGFIGSNLANHLADENEVVAVDDRYLGTPENLDDAVEFHDASVLDDDLPTDDVDVVFHLAALSSYKMHEENPTEGARVNVEGFVNTVEQARNDGCDTVVYASTSSIYGSRTEPSPEEMPVEARTGYEASKLARERYAEYFHHHYDMRTAGLRFFSVYQGFGGAEEHKGEFANTVAQFTDKIANGESPELFGDGSKGEFANTVAQFTDKIANGESPELFGDGSQTRDFTHVDDIVRGIEFAADHRLQGIYNLGTGESYSFNEMVDMINEALGTDVEPEYVENPLDVYVHDTKADCTKIREATGWEPKITFEEGVRRVCEPYLDE
ncbi:NAD-dependent epimerase/dehydratase family protein [Haloferax sp. ATCC BAA-645]|uniref:NAD-dependent epimerase/dehydratase family protein n=1 Tax=Haloferax sp. ATCC BAA-645 TaxID=1227463 RepID=UPI0002B1BA15|nr:NAD-dependent epimerase/dehydratase family protein [Haloferax sp. ATCC BAA-645]ELZ65583.1 nucleoside-diphosphate-sugar epimerase (UDP-glucose 4-epimerase) [Haloferax sp. ATCC BAA-645]